MRRLRGPTLLALLVLAAACGGDDGAATGSTPAGLVVGQEATDGALGDVVVVVDPERPGREEVAIADLGRGITAGPDRAFYEQGEEIVLLEATSGAVTPLDLRIGEVDLAYSRASVTGGGEQVAVLLAPTGENAALVTLEDGTVTDLLEATGASAAFGAEVAPDEATVLVNTDEGAHLVPVDDPEGARRLGAGAGELTDDGAAVLVSGDEGVTLHPVDGGEPTVVSEEPGGALAVADRVLLARGDEVALVEEDGTTVVTAPYSGSAPVAVGEQVLVPSGAGPSWTLLDAAEGTTAEVPELEGFVPGFSGRPTRWVPFVQTSDEGGIGGRLVLAVDTEDGSVVTVVDLPEGEQVVGLPVVADAGPAALISVDDAEGTLAVLADLDTGEAAELGRRLQGATFAPDGTRVAWSEGETAELRVAPTGDLDAAETLDTGIALPLWLPAG